MTSPFTKKRLKQLLLSDACSLTLSLVLLVAAYILSAAGAQVAYLVCCAAAILIAGFAVFSSAVQGILRRDLLDEKFLMSVACIGALILGELSEAATVMIFYRVGEYFQDRAVRKSRASVRLLMDIRPDMATVVRDGTEEQVDADGVAVGEHIVVRTGERIPIDAVILQGEADLDTSALTGESLPRHVKAGDRVESGAVVFEGVLHLCTTKTADTSAAARILDLVENATENKAKEERFITKFARVYTPIVVGLALILGVIVPLFDGFDFRTYIHRALIFLVISCPCALVISVPMTFFGGIGGAASKGILYKGGHVFSPLCHVHTVVFDKTGTLTEGRLRIASVWSVTLSQEELLRLAASAEYGSNHPIAKCLREAAGQALTPPKSSKEISGMGVEVFDGTHHIAVGNVALMEKNGINVNNYFENANGVVLHVAMDGTYEGAVLLSDCVKKEASDSIRALRALGVKHTVMLSGDTKAPAEAVGLAVGIDDVRSGLMPNEKYDALEKLIADARGSVMYVGDGINDAPSIARADIGVAMGAIGQDSAIEAADVVIMADALDRLPTAIRIAGKTLRIAKENIVFALGVKVAVMLLGAFGLAGMWLAVFADVGVAIIAILNAMRALHVKQSKVD